MIEQKLSHGYNTSTDYEKLFELVQHKRVVCFVTVKGYKDEDGYKLQDVCQSEVTPSGSMIDIGVRGISYISALGGKDRNIKDDFIKQCHEAELEFIDPELKLP